MTSDLGLELSYSHRPDIILHAGYIKNHLRITRAQVWYEGACEFNSRLGLLVFCWETMVGKFCSLDDEDV